jgi:hypothetical protein
LKRSRNCANRLLIRQSSPLGRGCDVGPPERSRDLQCRWA